MLFKFLCFKSVEFYFDALDLINIFVFLKKRNNKFVLSAERAGANEEITVYGLQHLNALLSGKFQNHNYIS